MALKPRYIASLKPGDHFELRDPIAGVVTGEVIRVPQSRGYVQVRIRQPERVNRLLSGASERTPARYSVLEWSAGTLVFKAKPGGTQVMYDTDNDLGSGSSFQVQKLFRRSGIGIEPGPISKEKLIPMAKITKSTKVNPRLQKVIEKKATTPKAPKAPKVPAPLNDCYCGCGEKVKNRFRQGHDGRYYGFLRRVAAGTLKFSELPASVQKRIGTPQALKKELAAHDNLRAKNKAERG